MPDIGLFEAIYSARSIRRLKPDPVPEELITAILDAAIRAPSGGNAQSWAFVVVRDPDQRQQLGAIYRKASDIAQAVYAARGRPPHLTEQQFSRMMTMGAHLWEHMGEAPVLLIPCARPPIVPAPRLKPVPPLLFPFLPLWPRTSACRGPLGSNVNAASPMHVRFTTPA